MGNAPGTAIQRWAGLLLRPQGAHNLEREPGSKQTVTTQYDEEWGQELGGLKGPASGRLPGGKDVKARSQVGNNQEKE